MLLLERKDLKDAFKVTLKININRIRPIIPSETALSK